MSCLNFDVFIRFPPFFGTSFMNVRGQALLTGLMLQQMDLWRTDVQWETKNQHSRIACARTASATGAREVKFTRSRGSIFIGLNHPCSRSSDRKSCRFYASLEPRAACRVLSVLSALSVIPVQMLSGTLCGQLVTPSLPPYRNRYTRYVNSHSRYPSSGR